MCLGFLLLLQRLYARRGPRPVMGHIQWAERHESLVRDAGGPYFSPHSHPSSPGIPDPKRP